MSLTPLNYSPPQNPRLEILHEDRDMLVVNKPGGLLSVPGRSTDLYDSVLSRVREIHGNAQAVHRLDLGTSGVLVIALRRKAEAALRQQFQDRQTRKIYLALVHGNMIDDHGSIDLPLVCDWPNRPMQKVCHETGKPALTVFSVLERHAATTLLRLFPYTGRSHQLRVHLAALGHPILGDNLYGPDQTASGSQLQLHASQLGLYHPFGGEWMAFLAPCLFAHHILPVPMEAPSQSNASLNFMDILPINPK